MNSLPEILVPHAEGCGIIKENFGAACEAARKIIQKTGETVFEDSLKSVTSVTSAVDKARRSAQLEGTETIPPLLTNE